MTHLSIANNVTTANVSVGSQNTSLHYSMVKFDIAWENSWRTVTNESNYDGCWIFVKFRKKNTYAWQHATFNYVSPGTAGASGHTEPSGSTISTPSDGKGIFIYRNAVGNGNINWTGAQLRWNYGADGVADNKTFCRRSGLCSSRFILFRQQWNRAVPFTQGRQRYML